MIMDRIVFYSVVVVVVFAFVGTASAWAKSDVHHEEPINWDVHFESGKESVALYDRASSMFEKRYLKIQNLAGPSISAKVGCEDRFSRFSKEGIQYGDVWEFTVYDWFGRRHYWCTVVFGNGKEYSFRAYGEGAPRGHNKIIMLLTGALINGRNVTME